MQDMDSCKRHAGMTANNGEVMNPIEYDIIIFKENKTFIAYCPELDVSSCGENIEQAKENLKTTVRLFLEEAEKMGTLEEILAKTG